MEDLDRKEEMLKELLQERAKIDELLQDKFTRDLTIMFTDIQGSTSYFESRGDINGLSMVFKHNQILFPVIETHQGRVIKTIGDAIMASFPDVVRGVGAAIEMQRTLSAYNAACPAHDRIHIRIGLHAGKGIAWSHDVFGDLVNVAARVESMAEPGQILISRTAFDALRYIDDVVCRFFDRVRFKGKKEAMELYRVVWDGEEGRAASAAPGAGSKAHYLDYEDVASCTLERVGEERGDREGVDEHALKGDHLVKKSVSQPISVKKALPFFKRVRLLGMGTLLVIILIVGALIWRERMVKDDLYQVAYQQLKERKIEESMKSFTRLKPAEAYFEGLAAVYWETGDYEKAMVMCERVDGMGRRNLYSHVIRGNILWSRGSIDEATREYEQATRLTSGADWQRAEAFNRLGRLYAAQHHPEKASAHYAQAAKYNPDSPEVYTNQGMLSERVGNNAEAVSSYEKALALKPQDAMVGALLEEAQRKKQLTEDQERSQQIDALVAELIRSYKEKDKKGTPTNEDSWTSTPLTLTVLNFERRGAPSLRDGEDEYFLLQLTAHLQESGRVQLVERDVLPKLLEELTLGASDLADPASALRIGRIVAARLIATGSFTRYEHELQVNIRLIEPETTLQKIVIVENAEQRIPLDELSRRVAHQIMERLTILYPLRGKVVSLKGEELLLNIGSGQGVSSGMVMKVMETPEPVKIKGKLMTPGGRERGMVRVTSVEPTRAYARIIEKSEDVQVGFSVEEVTPEETRIQGEGGREQ